MKTEKILAGIFLLGVLLKQLHFPGGNIAVIISLSTLMLLYFPFGFYFLSGKTFKDQVVPLSAVSGMVLSTPAIGIMFGLMHWPAASAMLLIGLLGSIPLSIIVFFLRRSNRKPELDNYYQNLLMRSVIVSLIALFLFVLPYMQA